MALCLAYVMADSEVALTRNQLFSAFELTDATHVHGATGAYSNFKEKVCLKSELPTRPTLYNCG